MPVDQPDVLVVRKIDYHLVPSLPRFQSRNPEIDWSKGQLIVLRTPVRNPGNEPTITSLPHGDGSAEEGAWEPSPAIYIQFLGTAAFDDLPASEVIALLAIQIYEGSLLLGA